MFQNSNIIRDRFGDFPKMSIKLHFRMAVLKFATDLDNLLLPGKIEEVSVPLLEHILAERDHLFALLYDEDDGRAAKIVKRLEGINDNLEKDKGSSLVEFGLGLENRIDNEFHIELKLIKISR